MTSKEFKNHRYIDIHTHSYNNYMSCTKAIYSYCPGLNGPPAGETMDFSIGIHPWSASQTSNIDDIKKLVQEDNCRLIGESGLDMHRSDNLLYQRSLLQKHIDLSESLKKPLLLHNVRATSELLKFYKKNQPKSPWVIHDFNGGPEEIFSLMKVNCYLSLGQNFMKSNSKISKHSNKISLDRLFFETDDSKKNIEEVYAKFSALNNIELQTLCDQVLKNYEELFTK